MAHGASPSAPSCRHAKVRSLFSPPNCALLVAYPPSPQPSGSLPCPMCAAPLLTSANAWGPTTGQATATPGAEPRLTFSRVGQHMLCWHRCLCNVSSGQRLYATAAASAVDAAIVASRLMSCPLCPLLQWEFTATPVRGGQAVTVAGPAPDLRFRGLQPNTQAS